MLFTLWQQLQMKIMYFTIGEKDPDLNHIENISHTVKRSFPEDALNRKTTRQDFAVFSTRAQTK